MQDQIRALRAERAHLTGLNELLLSGIEQALARGTLADVKATLEATVAEHKGIRGALGPQYLAPTEDEISLEWPAVGSFWRHRNGIVYEVTGYTNLHSVVHNRYPVMIVYRGNNGRVWSRPVTDWYRSFTPREAKP